MKRFTAVYLPIGVPTFELNSARTLFEESKKLLKEAVETVHGTLLSPEELLLSVDDLTTFFDGKDTDLIILQNATFANAAYATEVFRRSDAPVLLWTLREPAGEVGWRLKLNSLTGAFSAANTYRAFRDEPLTFVYGAPDEEKVKREVTAAIRAAAIKEALRHVTLAAVGHTPQGFGFGRALDAELTKTFGATLLSIEARELIDRAKGFTEDEITPFLEDAKKRTTGLEKLPEQNQTDFARLYKAYREFVEDEDIRALASRCWPDFFTAFGTPVCTVLSLLNDLGIASSCEADLYGALSMLIGQLLSGTPVFFGDPVSLDEEKNTITFWHCGMAPCSLAREDTGAEIGVHCNRKLGPTLEFGTREADAVTIFRVGKEKDGSFRFFIASGEALDVPKQYFGTTTVVRIKASAEKLVRSAVRDGWEPHFAVIFADVVEELRILADQLNLPYFEVTT